METDKLQKVLAGCGLGSRRLMEKWINEKRVSVNGKLATIGDRVSYKDKLMVDGQAIIRASHKAQIQCLLYHKPEGEICAVSDPKGRPTVFENLPDIDEGRWISVGRLDFNTSGLLLFTNNGELANKLMHPSTNLTRRYMARIRGDLTEDQSRLITKKGVMLDGKLAKFEDIRYMERITQGANNWVEVSIKEGRYREVRRIFDAVEHPVSRLKRTAYGSVKLTTSLKQGEFEKMAPLQLEKLLLSHHLDEFVPLVRKVNLAPKKGPGARESAPKQEFSATLDTTDKAAKPAKGRRRGSREKSKEEIAASRKEAWHNATVGKGKGRSKPSRSRNGDAESEAGRNGAKRGKDTRGRADKSAKPGFKKRGASSRTNATSKPRSGANSSRRK